MVELKKQIKEIKDLATSLLDNVITKGESKDYDGIITSKLTGLEGSINTIQYDAEVIYNNAEMLINERFADARILINELLESVISSDKNLSDLQKATGSDEWITKFANDYEKLYKKIKMFHSQYG